MASIRIPAAHSSVLRWPRIPEAIRVPIGMSDIVVVVGHTTTPRQSRIATAIRDIIILIGPQRQADKATRRLLRDTSPVPRPAVRRKGFGE